MEIRANQTFATSGMQFETACKIAKKEKLKIVYGTRSELWHVIDRTDRDWGIGITPEQFKLGESKSLAICLSPTFRA